MIIMKCLILEYVKKLDNLKIESVEFWNPKRQVGLDVVEGRWGTWWWVPLCSCKRDSRSYTLTGFFSLLCVCVRVLEWIRKGDTRSHLSGNFQPEKIFFHPAASKVARLFVKAPGLWMQVAITISEPTRRNKYFGKHPILDLSTTRED